MKYLIFIFFISCYQVQPELKGSYGNNDIELTFNKGKITGETKCNSVHGDYFINDNNISISVGGTKVFCENEFDIKKLRNIEYFEIIGNKLIFKSKKLELILYRL